MISKKSVKLTSTPFDLSQYESAEDGDSGYNSTFSGINSSVDSTLLVTHSKPHSTFKTPDALGDSGLGTGSDEKNSSRLEEFPSKYFRFPHLQANLTGKEYVDFLYYLGEKNNYVVILQKILNYLSDEDLYNAAAASRSWRSLILSIPPERKRLRIYNKKIEMTKENRNISHDNDGDLNHLCEEKRTQKSRPTLGQIENLRRDSTSSSSPLSASPVTHNYRFEAYQKEGRKLKLGKRLFSCPRCKLPSHVDEILPNTAVCTNSSCRYRFCILCQCGEHPHKMCDFISTPVARKQTSLVGTRNSKRNLKRLLM